jgi:hypothetical protein
VLGAKERHNPLNGKMNILFCLDNNKNNLYQDYYLKFTVSGRGTLDGWNSYYDEFFSLGITGCTPGDTIHTLIDGGGCSRGALTVGAYTSRTSFVDKNGDLQEIFRGDDVNDRAYFTSIGPTIDGRQKPEISTPGHALISAYNSFSTTATDSSTIADTIVFENRTYSYGAQSGTSMATPFMSGVTALVLQVYPEITREEILELLRETARTDEYTGEFSESEYSPWGYGKADISALLTRAVAKYHTSNPDIDSLLSGVFFMNYGVYINNPAIEEVALYTPQGRKLHEERITAPGAIDLSPFSSQIVVIQFLGRTVSVEKKLRVR